MYASCSSTFYNFILKLIFIKIFLTMSTSQACMFMLIYYTAILTLMSLKRQHSFRKLTDALLKTDSTVSLQ